MKFIILILLTLVSTKLVAIEQQTLQLSDGNEIQAEVYGIESNNRILWVAPGYGIKPRHQKVAKDLSKLGLQVWLVDLADALFLPRGTNTMRTISPNVVAELIQQLTREKHKLVIISSSYGSIPALRGVQAWQSSQPKETSLIGVVVFTPYFYAEVPTLGQDPELIPIQTTVPIYIFQAEKNGNRWHFPAQLKHIQQHSTVYSEIMPGVTSMFYDEDTSEATNLVLNNIARQIKQRIKLLAKHDYPLTAPAVTLYSTARLGLDEKLKPYRGSVQPIPFSLLDVNSKVYKRDDFKNKITIINFWASWCPPCVEEIPSLNRLRKKMQGKKFELISINYAQTAPQIKDFMQKVAVDFPVLIDPEGKISGKWNVVAFPSTFVIGPDGKIHYGVNAAIHWDTADVINQLNKLLSDDG